MPYTISAIPDTVISNLRCTKVVMPSRHATPRHYPDTIHRADLRGSSTSMIVCNTQTNSQNWQRPKSAILRLFLPSNRIFSGCTYDYRTTQNLIVVSHIVLTALHPCSCTLRSLWHTPWSWKYPTPLISWQKIFRAVVSSNISFSTIRSKRLPFVQSSINIKMFLRETKTSWSCVYASGGTRGHGYRDKLTSFLYAY